MIEGCQPFSTKDENDVPKLYAARARPPFNAPSKSYAYGLKEYALMLIKALYNSFCYLFLLYMNVVICWCMFILHRIILSKAFIFTSPNVFLEFIKHFCFGESFLTV